MTRFAVSTAPITPSPFRMYYVYSKLTIDSIFNPTIGICTVLFMKPQKYTLVAWGPRSSEALGQGLPGLLDKKALNTRTTPNVAVEITME